MTKYTLHFKCQAVLHYLHIRSQQRTADHYGISRTHLRRWIRAYQEGGIGALEHPQSKTMNQHRKNPFIADKPDHEKTQAELIEELCYMRAEVAYLGEIHSMMSLRPPNAASGIPPPMTLPIVVRSGVMRCSDCAPPSATRKPVITSS